MNALLAGERALLLPTIEALSPALNRIVFSGLPTCRGLLDVSAPRVRIAQFQTLQLDLHATSSLDRLGVELATHGVSRKPRRDGSEAWTVDAHAQLRVWGPPSAPGSADEGAVREYAVLLTRAESISERLTIRVTALPVQVALWCVMHTQSKREAIDSPWLDDVLAVMVGRRDCVEEVRALPNELRVIVADVVGAFAAAPVCRWVIGRILVEAHTTPQLVDAVLKRLESVAQIPRS